MCTACPVSCSSSSRLSSPPTRYVAYTHGSPDHPRAVDDPRTRSEVRNAMALPHPWREIVVHVERGEIGAEIAEVARVERTETIQRNAIPEPTTRRAGPVAPIPGLDHRVRRARAPRIEHGHEPRLHECGIDAKHTRLGVHRRAVRAPARRAELHELPDTDSSRHRRRSYSARSCRSRGRVGAVARDRPSARASRSP